MRWFRECASPVTDTGAVALPTRSSRREQMPLPDMAPPSARWAARSDYEACLAHYPRDLANPRTEHPPPDPPPSARTAYDFITIAISVDKQGHQKRYYYKCHLRRPADVRCHSSYARPGKFRIAHPGTPLGTSSQPPPRDQNMSAIPIQRLPPRLEITPRRSLGLGPPHPQQDPYASRIPSCRV